MAPTESPPRLSRALLDELRTTRGQAIDIPDAALLDLPETVVARSRAAGLLDVPVFGGRAPLAAAVSASTRRAQRSKRARSTSVGARKRSWTSKPQVAASIAA